MQELDEDFKDGPNYQQLSEEEKLYIISVMEKMMAMGMAGIYGDESEHQPDANVTCNQLINQCKARCCTFIFALTKEEVEQGLVQYNKNWPFFIARDEDGYCPHLDRKSLACEVWHNRPLRCRRYDCREDEDV